MKLTLKLLVSLSVYISRTPLSLFLLIKKFKKFGKEMVCCADPLYRQFKLRRKYTKKNLYNKTDWWQTFEVGMGAETAKVMKK